jgi:hypothetical protein
LANKQIQQTQDKQKAIELLGREPRTPFIIKTRCSDGMPQVLLADPVFCEDNIWKPFPTFLWLVCPELKIKAAHLEQDGLITEFSQRLSQDEAFREEFLLGQEEIRSLRLKMAKEIYENFGELPKHISSILQNTTIAGSKDYHGVKCLHAHLAQELAYGNNIIGREVLAITGNCTGQHERTRQ